ncbi:Ap4A phosphorylase II [Capsaspora owczarzaki ATCC 30864]|uniref:Ap4A phosphorylase II n=1 Tax=Capsaspora owczarzaki (strain ATCC 30864) TaxID=595528 RepID=A0A0D2X469_CAPO3|nr:Ap4A phosphorylase II [Capsaspora owczarzaki ATCC 30864]KJE95539.1 Ap4A phosphorylase II [Capsaspora owczarzaki ATCC 30864]|eukprot:XP_004345578.1 Ap4A phosphorylase II [Capsaspora owczarzaki ATCC 30864]
MASPASAGGSSSSSSPQDLINTQPEQLAETIRRSVATARAAGSLFSIDARSSIHVQEGVQFIIRVSNALDKKKAEDKRTEEKQSPKDPFMAPFEPGMFVGRLSDTHSAVLNKFNIVENHTLVITRDFVPQGTPLTLADMTSTLQVVDALDGFGFYNCGPLSGASQPHKHTQVFPRNTPGIGSNVPIEAALPPRLANEASQTVHHIPAFSRAFRHAFVWLTPSKGVSASGTAAHAHNSVQRAQDLHAAYLKALDYLEIPANHPHEPADAAPSYNVLFTAEWLLVVPRAADSHDGIGCNAVGFTGSLFVRTPEDAAKLEVLTPLGLLAAVGFKTLS